MSGNNTQGSLTDFMNVKGGMPQQQVSPFQMLQTPYVQNPFITAQLAQIPMNNIARPDFTQAYNEKMANISKNGLLGSK